MPWPRTVFHARKAVYVSQISRVTSPLLAPVDPIPTPKPPTPTIRPCPSMATPRHHVPLLLLATLAAVAVGLAPAPVPTGAALGGGGGRGPLLGGWSPIPDVGDRHIQELGGWALGQAKHQRLAAAALRFRRVVRGEQQVVSGMNYRLYVDAADPAGRTVPYVAVVYEQVWTSTRKLTSFNPAPRAN